ncbi:transposase [Bradyrhizobium sp.]|uniref:transposase n=1 Tax=Bradyrhizobium sp. TaxID=376 RepID=UPI002E0AFBEA|nr:transposase [Bradyrhizobium sp.]
MARNDLARGQASRFYDKLQETLEILGFAAKVHALCAPVYSSGAKGRPPIDPVVYFKMLMVGFLENLPSERAIASRCGDSLMIRRFLGCDLDEDTPHHSSFTVIRQRLAPEVFQAVFEIILAGLRAHGLLRGKNLGLDSSVMEANASLRALEHRNTGEAYWDYVRRLAAEAGVDGEDAAAVRRFDRQRPGRKTSNQEWVNPNDPDAKVAPAKDGAIDMLYKPEHVVDLDTGAIVRAEVRLADQADTTDLAERVMGSVAMVEKQRAEALAGQEKPVPAAPCTLTGDKGYFCVAELEVLQECGLKTVLSDPLLRRRVDQLAPPQRAVVRRARQAAQSRYGKDLLRRRGMHIERSFAHLLDCGGMRRATLCGQVNLDKRYQIAAATYNLSQLMRHLFGMGTAKQAAAAVQSALWRLHVALHIAWELLRTIFRGDQQGASTLQQFSSIELGAGSRLVKNGVTSTGC